MSINPFGSVKDDRLVDETAADNGDPVYSRERLSNMTNTRLRNLAAEADTDLINGKSPKLLVIAYYACMPEIAVSNGDLVFTKSELDSMSEDMLRTLAESAKTGLVDWDSDLNEIHSYFRGQRGLNEFCED